MAGSWHAIERIRLSRCAHGTFHLNLGNQTLHLDTREILLLGQVINRWLQRYPGVFSEVDGAWWNRVKCEPEIEGLA